jgi:protein XagA
MKRRGLGMRPAGILTLAGLWPAVVFGGAWPRPAGETYGKLDFSRAAANEIYEAKGNQKRPGPDFQDLTASLYMEYGLTDRWTWILYLPYKSAVAETAGVRRTATGFSDAWTFLKRGMAGGAWVLSGQAGVKVPLGYEADRVPALGQGQVDGEARLLLGRSFHPKPIYGNLEVGYRLRRGAYSDEIPYRVEAGVFPARPVLVKLALDGTKSLANDRASTSPNRPPNVFDQQSTRLAPGLAVFLGRGFAVEAGYEITLAGGNAADLDTLSLGLSWQGRP